MHEGRGTLVGSGWKSLPPKQWLPTLGLQLFQGKRGKSWPFWVGAGPWGAVGREELRPPLQPGLGSSSQEQGSVLALPPSPVSLFPPHPISSLSCEAGGNTCQHSFIQQCFWSTCYVPGLARGMEAVMIKTEWDSSRQENPEA